MSWSDQNYVEQTNYYMHSHDPFSLRALPWTAFAHPVSVWWGVFFFTQSSPFNEPEGHIDPNSSSSLQKCGRNDDENVVIRMGLFGHETRRRS